MLSMECIECFDLYIYTPHSSWWGKHKHYNAYMTAVCVKHIKPFTQMLERALQAVSGG